MIKSYIPKRSKLSMIKQNIRSKILVRNIKKIFKKNFHSKENHKFSHLNKEEIIRKITKLQKILGIEDKLSYKILSDRTLLIKQK